MKEEAEFVVELRSWLSLFTPCGDEVHENTPRRFFEAMTEMTAGYRIDPRKLLVKTFEDSFDEMVVVRDMPYWSLCEHHLLPFFGTATIGYIPAHGMVVGLSKLPRLLHCFSRRLQMQERLTRQIGEAIDDGLSPVGTGVVVKGRHLCMEIRGVKTNAETVTSFLSGALRDDEKARAEFLELAR